MKPIFDDLRKAEKFIKEMEGKDRTRIIAELSNLLFHERTVGAAMANAEIRQALGDVISKALPHVSVDILELIINHSGKGIRLLRETNGKKSR